MEAVNKRKALGNDFQKLVDSKDDEKIIEFLEKCEVNACGGTPERCALCYDLSEKIIDWLIEHGADINFADSHGATPLHYHSVMKNGKVEHLIELGADMDAEDCAGHTALTKAVINFQVENARVLIKHRAKGWFYGIRDRSIVILALSRADNINLYECAQMIECIRNGGYKLNDKERKYVLDIGREFEMSYDSIDPTVREKSKEGLERLYALCEIGSGLKKIKNQWSDTIIDEITVESKSLKAQNEELWDMLVPEKGSADTVQGEVIRICGRMLYEIMYNGGINWDDDYVKMSYAVLDYMMQGNYDEDELKKCSSILKDIRRGVMIGKGEADKLRNLATKWVLKNRIPIKLEKVAYQR